MAAWALPRAGSDRREGNATPIRRRIEVFGRRGLVGGVALAPVLLNPVLLNQALLNQALLDQAPADQPPLGQAKVTAWIGGKVWVISLQCSPWSSVTHNPPVVDPKARRSPVPSIARAWR